MTPVILLLSGAVLVWIGMTDSLVDALDLTKDNLTAPGYPSIPFLPYVIAALVVTMPLVLIKDSNQWAWKYVLLILVMAVVTNYEGLEKFTSDLSSFYVS